jgi:uncharacterized cupredoxin-like copper-binding protein
MKLLISVLGVSLIVALAGCGGNDNNKTTSASTSTTTTPSSAAGTSGTLQVSETDFKLNPSNPTVSKPGVVEIKATNDGQVEHSLEVEGPNGEAKLSKTLAPGDSGTLKVDLSKPGKYEWYCPIDNHKGMGMRGEITVKASSSTGSGSSSSGSSSGSSGSSSGSSGSSSSGSSGGGY